MPAWFKALLDLAITALTASLGGVQAWLVKQILKFGGQALYDNLALAKEKIERAINQWQASREYKKVVNDPTKTTDERAEAYAKYINSR